jgi:hypothetical protein
MAEKEKKLNQDEYSQQLIIENRPIDVIVRSLAKLQVGDRGEGVVSRVVFSGENIFLNGLVCIEKKIHTGRLSEEDLVPENQLRKYELMKNNGAIVPTWMFISKDGESIYIEDLTFNGSKELIDLPDYKHRAPQLFPDPEWITSSKGLLISQLATNIVASAKSRLIMVPDSMFLVNDKDRALVVGDFGQGITDFQEGDLLQMNTRGISGLLQRWGSNYDLFSQLVTAKYLEKTTG